MKVDCFLRELLFRKFHIAGITFDFLEALLAVCITGTGFLLRTSFPDSGMANGFCLLAEWMLAVSGAVLVTQITGNGRKGILTYGIFLILPVMVADGTILGGQACVGALLCMSALLFLKQDSHLLFSIAMAAVMLLHVRYIGFLPVCILFCQMGRLRKQETAVLTAAGVLRFCVSYRAWFQAGYTLTTFHWPNIYEIVGREAMQGQLIDPLSSVGFFLTLGLLIMGVWILAQGSWKELDSETILELLLFFGLAAVFFLPYMDQTAGYVFCILSVVYGMVRPNRFWIPVGLQIVTFAGYQEAFHGESMMSMWVFALIQLCILAVFAAELYRKAKVTL